MLSSEDPSKEFVSADFCSRNEKLLVTVSGKSEARVTIWNWDKQRCISTIELLPNPRVQTVEQVSFSSIDPNIVVVTGQELYRFYRLDGAVLKP